MESTELDRLEDKVARAIKAIKKLQAENQQLKHQNDALRNQLKATEQTIHQLKTQSQNVSDTPDQSQIYRELEEKIKVKIKQMLEKLETLQ